jgi:hypothetical protein
MQRAIIFTLLLLVPSVLQARVFKWEGKPLSVSISTERLTQVEFPETLRSIFLSRLDVAVEKEDGSLYVRALAPEVADTLFVIGESGTTYEINLSTSDNPDQTVVISYFPKSLQAELRDESLEESDNLPDVLAQEIVEDLEAALEQFRESSRI